MVVINKDARSLFGFCSGRSAARRAELYQRSVRAVSAPSRMPSGRSISKSGSKGNIADDFPVLKPMLASQTGQAELSSRTLSDGRGGYLAVERMFFDASDPSRFLLLVNHLPARYKRAPVRRCFPAESGVYAAGDDIGERPVHVDLAPDLRSAQANYCCGTGDRRRKSACAPERNRQGRDRQALGGIEQHAGQAVG